VLDCGSGDGGDVLSAFSDVRTYLERYRAAAAASGAPLRPPLLVLGTSERVGSNWLSDTLGLWWQQHNEPLRQQLGPAHPLSSANPNPVADLDQVELGGLGRHWLATFVVGKYTSARQVIKETNLFFATRPLLDLFPDSPVVVASRSPLGVASSFGRGDLFTRWCYRQRYTQLAAAAARPALARWSPLLPDDNPDELTALLRLVVTNTLLVAEAVNERRVVHLPYEQAVLDRPGALAALGTLLGEDLTLPPATAHDGQPTDDTFATTTDKTALVAHLTPDTAERIRSGTADLLENARHVVTPAVLARAAGWLGGDHCYRLSPGPRPGPARINGRQVILAADGIRPRWLPHGLLSWRDLLVSNDEYAAFLNALTAAGITNTRDGVHLFAVPMPAGRGGRLHVDSSGRWTAHAGYGNHPVYWVTWIGAACFAAHAGARLPTRTEASALTRGLPLADINAAYRHGDVTPVAEPGRGPDEMHHPVGNLQIWCTDGPDTMPHAPAARWLHGAAWNTPATAEQVHRPRHRHLLGASRGVGIRLVRDGNQRQVGPADLTDVLRAWLTSLNQSDDPLGDVDQALTAALQRLQADVDLRPHVRPGPGKP
jgi:hypothetical protein